MVHANRQRVHHESQKVIGIFVRRPHIANVLCIGVGDRSRGAKRWHCWMTDLKPRKSPALHSVSREMEKSGCVRSNAESHNHITSWLTVEYASTFLISFCQLQLCGNECCYRTMTITSMLSRHHRNVRVTNIHRQQPLLRRESVRWMVSDLPSHPAAQNARKLRRLPQHAEISRPRGQPHFTPMGIASFHRSNIVSNVNVWISVEEN